MIFYEYPPTVEAALQILMDCGIDSFPVEPKTIGRKIGIRICCYSKSWPALEKMGQAENARNGDGISFYGPSGPIISYDDSMSEDCCRVIIGHEIGHIVMRHVKFGGVSVCDYCDPLRTYSPLELAANLFCEQLLAPPCVLTKMQPLDKECLRKLCHINDIAAEFVLGMTEERGLGYAPLSKVELLIAKRFRQL